MTKASIAPRATRPQTIAVTLSHELFACRRRASSGARMSQPLRDRRPRLLERARAHEETDVSAGDQLLLDPTFRGSDEVLRREDLLAGRDVVALAGEEIEGTGDRLQVQAAAEPDKLALGESVLLEQLADRLQVPPAGQVERIFVPAVEHLGTLFVRRIVDVLIEVEGLREIMLLRMHVLP